MKVTEHSITDANYFDYMKNINKSINQRIGEPNFKISTSLDDFDDRSAQWKTFVAKEKDTMGVMTIKEFDYQDMREWIYFESGYQVVNKRRSPIDFDEMIEHEPFSADTRSSAFVTQIEAYERRQGVGRKLIDVIKERHDYILLRSTLLAEPFYEELGFNRTKFNCKSQTITRPFFYWRKE